MNGVGVRVEGLTKHYVKGGVTIPVLERVDLELAPGDRVAILGPSGSGKSTFLHLLGLLDRASSGTIALDNQDVSTLPAVARDRIRNRKVGYVFQSHNLLTEHSALDNVAIPVRLAGGTESVAHARAQALLEAVGLGHRLHHQPGELSGGEQQRVALARALVMGPGLVLADEPTGNLDPSTAQGVFELMMDLNRRLGTTLVVVTHSMELAKTFPRRLVLRGRRLEDN